MPNPSVSDFISFHNLKPHERHQCIYITKEGMKTGSKTTCTLKSKNQRARELFNLLNSTDVEVVDLGLLREYAKASCCAMHQKKIVGMRLLDPLAERWLGEIRQRRLEIGFDTLAAVSGTSPGGAYLSPPVEAAAALPPHPVFRAHIGERGQTVVSKLRQPLKTRGRLYIYARGDAPGFLKIGWTAGNVMDRLESWGRKCGYSPILVHNTPVIRHAERAETLVHYELEQEWRAEEQCLECGKRHVEWFEVSRERAVRVVNSWAALMTLPDSMYDEEGEIVDSWASIVDAVAAQNRPVTAERLLEYYQRHCDIDIAAIASARVAYLTEQSTMETSSPPVSSWSTMEAINSQRTIRDGRESAHSETFTAAETVVPAPRKSARLQALTDLQPPPAPHTNPEVLLAVNAEASSIPGSLEEERRASSSQTTNTVTKVPSDESSQACISIETRQNEGPQHLYHGRNLTAAEATCERSCIQPAQPYTIL
ncbi:meiotically up-regulated gene 113-domain-containing protein [Microdochium bolleyi]|uniref:Meiotically up-regulated gene 113-domain-containing protein n=1 Tax=Microdochium bolleyi TaxID=196109 RepID=A0A136JH62_9PEZI|nr:meiotically up-regulated gene 113-domain-containing protein [Microdochium bolleyi]